MLFKISILFLLTLPVCSESLKDIVFDDAVISEVTSIYDGDTFRANIKGYPPIVGYRMAIRLNNIDTPEIKSKCDKEKKLALKAKELTVSLLRNAKVIELKNVKRGKYFRLLADVYVDNKSIGQKLIQNRLALPYKEGSKINWCK